MLGLNKCQYTENWKNKYDRPSINQRIINMASAGKRDWGEWNEYKVKTSPATSSYKGDILFL